MGKNSTNNEGQKEGRAIPIEKLKYATGDNQEEHYDRLRKHQAEEVLGMKYGDKLMKILKYEVDVDLKSEEPKLKTSVYTEFESDGTTVKPAHKRTCG